MSNPYGQPEPSADGAAATQVDRTWALLAHIGSLVAAWLALGFFAPLVVMLVKSDRPFVRRHAVESLNFQISLLIYSLVAAVVGFLLVVVTLGVGLFVVVPVAVVLGLLVLALIILATVKASNGEDYRYPLTIRLIP